MKLGHLKKQPIKESSDSLKLKSGLSDDLNKYADKVSDKSGTQVVKELDTVRNLDKMNQTGGDIRKKVNKYDTQVSKQVKDSLEESVKLANSLKRKYLNLIESQSKAKVKDEGSFKYKRNEAVKSPVFEQRTLPKRKKVPGIR